MQYKKQLKDTGENRFCQPTHSFLTCLATDMLPLRNFAKLKFCYDQKKKSHSHHRRICVTCKLEKQLRRCVCCIKTIFLNSYKISRKLPIKDSDYCNATVQHYLNYSPQWIFFFQHSNNWEIVFRKNSSERLLRQLLPVSMSWLYIQAATRDVLQKSYS